MTDDWVPPPPRSELIWAATDFDGTLAESTWSAENPTALPGSPIWRNLKKLQAARDAGLKVVIYTSRPSADYELIESWLCYWGIPHDKIVTGKLLAAVYVDDRARHSEAESWLP